MAVLGMTKTDAVNAMLFGIGERRVSSLQTTQATKVGDAEYLLDQIDRRIQAMGWPENVDFNATLTPQGTPKKVTVPEKTLWVRGCYRDGHRSFTLRGDTLYDRDRRTDEFPDATPINVDICKQIDFEDLEPRTKELIAVAATQVFQRRTRGSPTQDAMLAEERMIADIIAGRIDSRMIPSPVNPYPIQLRSPSPAEAR